VEAALALIAAAVQNGDETSDLTLKFHQIFAAAGHNAYLVRMSELLDQARVAQFMRVESSLPDVKAGEFESHHALLDAIRSRDPEIAREAMREHLRVAHGHEERVNALRKLQRPPGVLSPIDSNGHSR
jgi:DNA-binding FadR family transcriptional regulator